MKPPAERQAAVDQNVAPLPACLFCVVSRIVKTGLLQLRSCVTTLDARAPRACSAVPRERNGTQSPRYQGTPHVWLSAWRHAFSRQPQGQGAQERQESVALLD